jgi:hypothetical protein
LVLPLYRNFLLRIYNLSQIGLTGFSAKSIASGHFIDQRSMEMNEKGDNDIKIIDLATNKIDENGQFATACLWIKNEAIYREGFRATLVDADFDVTSQGGSSKEQNYLKKAFPYGNQGSKDTVFSSVDYAKLNAAVANALIRQEGQKNVLFCDT